MQDRTHSLHFGTRDEADDYNRRLENAGWTIIGAQGTDTWLCEPPTSDGTPIVIKVGKP